MLFAVGYPGGPWALERSLEVGPSDGFLTGTRGPAQLGKRFLLISLPIEPPKTSATPANKSKMATALNWPHRI
jgi:hypothetical protein